MFCQSSLERPVLSTPVEADIKKQDEVRRGEHAIAVCEEVRRILLWSPFDLALS